MPNEFEELLKIQRNIAARLMQENQTDNKIKFYNLIRNLKPTLKEQILIIAEQEGFSEEETLNLLGDLERDKMVIQDGAYIKVL